MIATIILFTTLGLDTLAVALGVGLSGLPRSRWARLALTYAAFEGGMPIVGLLIGRRVGPYLGDVATYLAAMLLLVIGLLTMREALDDAEEPPAPMRGASAGRTVVMTGLSIGLDELAVGVSMGVLGVSIGPALAYLAVQAFAFTILGLYLGHRVHGRLGERAELVSGIVLTLLALALMASEATGRGLL